MSIHLLDSEKYIEDDYIDSSYFGGLLDGEGLWTYYFDDSEPYYEEQYYENRAGNFVLTADLTIAIVEVAATLSSAFAVSADGLILLFGSADLSSAVTAEITGDRIVDQTADLQSTASVVSTAFRTRNVSSDVIAQVQSSVDANRIRFATAAAEIIVDQTVSAGAIRQGEASITGAFSPTLTATFLRLGDIDMSSVIAFEAAVQRFRDPSATTLANILNLNAQAAVFQGTTVDVTILSEMSATLDPLMIAEASVSAIFVSEISGRLIKGFSSNIASVFTQGVDLGDNQFGTNVEAIFPLEAEMSVASSTSVSGERIRFANTEFVGVATQISVAGFLQSDIANLISSFALAADIGVIKPLAANISSESSLTCDAVSIVSSTSNLISESTSSVLALKIVNFSADLITQSNFGTAELGLNAGVLPSVVKEDSAVLQVTATLAALGGETTTLAADVEMVSAVAATANVIKSFEANITDAVSFAIAALVSRTTDTDMLSISTISIVGDRLRTASAVLGITAGCTTDPGFIVDGSTSVTGRFTISAVVGTLNISTDRTYVVPREHRLYAIPTENRTHSITRENRVYTIQGAA